MSFSVPADAYDRFMGRYSWRLAPVFADFAGIDSGARALDVGCGPGALTTELAHRLGAESVAATDPSDSFAKACSERIPGADVRHGAAEQMPWPTDSFDRALAQLVFSFVADAGAALAEMRRVTREGGVVAACTWPHAGGMEMLLTFRQAVQAIDPSEIDQARPLPYSDLGSLQALWQRAGLREIEMATLMVEAEYTDFEDYWQPFMSGVGPASAYLVSRPPDQQATLREECFRRLGEPDGRFALSASACAVRGTV